jgi:hypothetical protein
MDSRPATPRQSTVKADGKIAFSGPHGLIVARIVKGAEVDDVPWNIRCKGIRYNGSRLKGVCQALISDLPAPPGELTRPDVVNEAESVPDIDYRLWTFFLTLTPPFEIA